ncbi:MAG TPA: O-acetyl-ADP-ribose deacetylase [Chitinophagaceae bacterium]|nr:O-acetyl-ADP-ribose deacetylase [Chitinophagaceae bacterium]
MIRTIDGDITSIKVDAIVNAANSSLLGGGGVDGAIHRVGGHAILEDCMRIHEKQGGCQVGEAVITTAGRLPAKYVIHAVGPVWLGGNGQEDFLLAKAYRNSLRLAVEYQLRSIAFPNISTGMYHYPKERAASIAIMAVSGFLQQPGTLREVIFVCFDPENSKLYADILGE